MSYCRWSCDRHKSDVYVYLSACGYEVLIAGNRIVGECPESSLQYIAECGREGVECDFHYAVKMQRIQHEFLENCERKDIDHELAGVCRTFVNAEECWEFLEHLIDEGFHVPDGVIEGLKEEYEEEVDDQA